jgi:hypothetical protein
LKSSHLLICLLELVAGGEGHFVGGEKGLEYIGCDLLVPFSKTKIKTPGLTSCKLKEYARLGHEMLFGAECQLGKVRLGGCLIG